MFDSRCTTGLLLWLLLVAPAAGQTTQLPPDGRYVPDRVVVGFKVPPEARLHARSIDELEAAGMAAVAPLVETLVAETPECVSVRPLLQDVPPPVSALPSLQRGTSVGAAGGTKLPPLAAERLTTPRRRVENPLKYMQILELRPGTDLLAVIQRLEVRPEVTFAGVDGIVSASYDPNDPYYVYGILWGMEKIKAPEAWSVETGSTNVRVAVIDSGISYTHPELAGPRIINGWDYVNNDGDSTDDDGHGTHVAGTVGATMDNNTGVVGVAQCEVLGVKVLGADGTGFESWCANGINYSVNSGADILNLSLGAPYQVPQVEAALNYAAASGCLAVCASGNSAGPVKYPAAYASSIAVGGSNSADGRYSYSCFGAEQDLAAPAVGITSTDLGGGYTSGTGTSQATPHVAGAGALLKSHNAGLTAADVRMLLESTADDLGAVGWDPYFGHGRINLQRAFAEMGGVLTVAEPHVLPDGEINVAYGAAALAATGGYSPYTWQTLPLEVQTLAPTQLSEGYFRDWRADEQVWSLQLPIAFPYGGTTYTHAWVSSNGFIDFGSAMPDPDHTNSSYELGQNVRIAPLWDDLATDGIINRPEDIYIDQPDTDSFMIRWQAHTYGGSQPVNVACLLFTDGRVRFDYGAGNQPITPTVGLGFGGGQRITVSGYNGASDLGDAGSLLFVPNSLPSGLTLAADGTVSGTPQQGGIFNARVRVEDAIGQGAEQTFSLFINDPATQPPRILDITPWPGSQMWSNKLPSPMCVTVLFSEDVVISAADVAVVGDLTGAMAFDFTYDPSTFTAILSFDGTLPEQAYTITIADDVTDGDGMSLDGEIVADQLPSGDLVQGGDAVWTLEVMPWWGEFRANTYTAGIQNLASVGPGPNGEFVISWRSDGQDGDGYGLYAQRFDANGSKLGPEFRAHQETMHDQYGGPFLFDEVNNNYAVHWQQLDSTTSSMFIRRFDPECVPLGAATLLATAPRQGTNAYSSIALRPNGGVILGWKDELGGAIGGEVFARRFDTNDQPDGPAFQVSNGAEWSPDVNARPLINPDDSFAIIWQGWYATWAIQARQYDASAQPLGPEFYVNPADRRDEAGPQARRAPNGDIVVVWHDSTGDADGTGCFARWFDANWSPLGGSFLVNTYTTGDQLAIGIAMKSDGEHVMAWISQGQDGSGSGVYAQRFRADGARIGGEFRVNITTSGSQAGSALAYTSSGGFIAVMDYTVGVEDQDVVAQYFDVTPPSVVSAVPAAESVAPATGTSTISVTFDVDVVAEATHFAVVDDRAVTHDDFTFSYDAQTYTATLVFAAPLPAGRSYQVTVDDSVYRRDLRPGITEGVDDFQVFLDGEWDDVRYPSGDGLEGGDAVWSFTIGRDAPWAGESRISRTLPGDQTQAVTAGLRDDVFVAAWVSDTIDGDGAGIAGGRFDRFGYPIGWEFPINQVSTGDQSEPALAAFRSGEYVVVWSGVGADDDTGIYARKFDPDGFPLTDEIRVNETVADVQNAPTIAISEDGQVVIAWQSVGAGRTRSDFGIVARMVAADLSFASAELVVNTVTTGDQTNPHAAWLDSGKFLIVWERLDGDGLGVFGQAYGVEGLKVGGEFQLHADILGDQQRPCVAGLPDGGFLAVWQDSLLDGDGWGIIARAFDVDFVGDTPFVLSDVVAGDQTLPAIARLTGSDLVVTWQSTAQTPPGDPDQTGIYCRRIDWEDAQPLGPGVVVNTWFTGVQQRPAVGGLSSGDFVIAWDGLGPFSEIDGVDVYARWFDATPPVVSGMGTMNNGMGVTGLVLEFSEAVNVAASAIGVVGQGSGSQTFTSEYDDHAWVLTLTFDEQLPRDVFDVIVPTTAVSGTTGSSLDGNGDGLAGDDLAFALVTNRLGDFNGDSSVDLTDFVHMGTCFGGPGVPFGAGCEAFDFDGDLDVDMLDVLGFQNTFGQVG